MVGSGSFFDIKSWTPRLWSGNLAPEFFHDLSSFQGSYTLRVSLLAPRPDPAHPTCPLGFVGEREGLPQTPGVRVPVRIGSFWQSYLKHSVLNSVLPAELSGINRNAPHLQTEEPLA